MVGFYFMAALSLVAGDLSEDGFVMLGGGERGGFVVAVKGSRDDEGKGHASFAGSGGTTNAVDVRSGGCGKVEIEDACNILEVNAAGDAVLFVFFDYFAFFLFGLVELVYLLGLLGQSLVVQDFRRIAIRYDNIFCRSVLVLGRFRHWCFILFFGFLALISS